MKKLLAVYVFLVFMMLAWGFGAQAQLGSNDRGISTDTIDANTAAFIDFLTDIEISSTGYVLLPKGTTAQRPGSPVAGMFRYNTTDNTFEGYTDEWGPIAGGGGLSEWTANTAYEADDVVFLKDDNVYKVYLAKAGFTSGANFAESNWFELSKSRADQKELLLDGSFEYGVFEWSCTNATVTQAAGGVDGDFHAQIDFTAAGGFCELVSPVSGDKANQEYVNSVRIKTSSPGVTAEFKDGTRVVKDIPIDRSGNYFFNDVQMIPTTNVAFRITGDSGEQAFVDDAGHTLGGHPTFESVFKKTVDVTLTNSGAQNLTGTLRVSRIGDQVIITSPSGLTHDSSNNATSASGILPEWAFTGTETFSNSYFSTGDEDRYFQVLPSGGVQFTYQISSTGAGLIRTSTGSIPTISYNLNDEYSTPDTIAAVGTTDFKTVTKTLTSGNVVATGVMGDLTFSDLEVGAKYLLVFQSYCQESTSGDVDKICSIAVDNGVDSLVDSFTQINSPLSNNTKVVAKFFTASSSSLTFNVSGLTNALIPSASDRTYAQLTKIPDTANLVAELSDTLKYENAGPMIGGYASFGGATDGSVCPASTTCTKYRDEGLGANMSAVANASSGNYDVTITGLKPNSNLECGCESSIASASSGSRNCALTAFSFQANASGVATFEVNTYVLNASSTAGEDHFFTIACNAKRP